MIAHRKGRGGSSSISNVLLALGRSLFAWEAVRSPGQDGGSPWRGVRSCWRWGWEKENSIFPVSAVLGRGLGAGMAEITRRRKACSALSPPWPGSASAGVTVSDPGTGSPCTMTLSGDPPEARPGPQLPCRSPRPSLRSHVPTCPSVGRRSREPDTPANSTPTLHPPTPNCLPFVHQRRNLFLLGSGVRQKDPAPGAPGSPLLSLHAARGDLSGVPGAMEPATRPETGSRCVRAGAGAETAAGGDQGGQRGPLEGGQWAPGSGSLAASRSGRALVGGLGAGARVTAFQGEGVLAGRPHPTWGLMAGPGLGRREPTGGHPASLRI